MKYNKGEFVTIPNKSALRGLSPNLQVLFFWLCDHSDDNMKSFPSRQTLAAECGMGVKTLDRSMQQLVELGYVVKSVRTNKEEHLTNLYEVVIFDHTTPKEGGSVNLTLGGSVKKDPRVASNLTPPSVKKDIENSTHLTQPTELNNLDKSKLAEASYGKPEINELFEYWAVTTGIPIQSKVQRNRQACYGLYRKYGETAKVKQLIEGVALAQRTDFAPRIADFIALQAKLTDLLVWGRSKNISVTKNRIVKV